MPAQLMFGISDVNASRSGLPLVVLRALAIAGLNNEHELDSCQEKGKTASSPENPFLFVSIRGSSVFTLSNCKLPATSRQANLLPAGTGAVAAMCDTY